MYNNKRDHLQEEASNLVPADAVIRGLRAVSVLTRRKGRTGGSLVSLKISNKV
jgi:hypothetical protein